MKTCSVYHSNQNRIYAENKAFHCIRDIYLCLFDYKALLVCVKDRTCLRMEILAYCSSTFGSIFGALFVYLLKS